MTRARPEHRAALKEELGLGQEFGLDSAFTDESLAVFRRAMPFSTIYVRSR